MKKKLGFIVGIILFALVVVLGIAFYFVNEISAKILLNEEVESVSTLDLTKDSVDMNIKSKGKYAEVEKAIKNYFNDYAIHVQKILSIMNDDEFVNVLSIENYKSDGKDFVKTKEYIEKTKTDLNESFTKLIQITDAKEMINYLDSNVGEKYVKLYQEYMYDDSIKKELEESRSSLEESKELLDHTIEVYEKVIAFLSQNKNGWNIENDQIVFDTQELLDQFNQYLSEI